MWQLNRSTLVCTKNSCAFSTRRWGRPTVPESFCLVNQLICYAEFKLYVDQYIFIFIYRIQLRKWSKQLHILTEAWLKYTLDICICWVHGKNIFPVTAPNSYILQDTLTLWSWTCRVCFVVVVIFLFLFSILSKLPHLFQASWNFSTQQCLDCQSLDHCTSAQNKNKKSRAYSTKDLILQCTDYFDLHRAAPIHDRNVLKWLSDGVLFESQCKVNEQAKKQTSENMLTPGEPYISQ